MTGACDQNRSSVLLNRFQDGVGLNGVAEALRERHRRKRRLRHQAAVRRLNFQQRGCVLLWTQRLVEAQSCPFVIGQGCGAVFGDLFYNLARRVAGVGRAVESESVIAGRNPSLTSRIDPTSKHF